MASALLDHPRTVPRKFPYSWPLYNHSSLSWLPIPIRNEFGTWPDFQVRKELRKSVDFMQRLQIESRLQLHTGCVNALDWDSNGQLLVSGSDDVHIVVWDMTARNAARPFRYKTLHTDNIFSVKFLDNCGGREVISSSGDGMIVHTKINESACVQDCYNEDGTVRLFDTRQAKTACNPDASCSHSLLVNMEKAVSSIALNPIRSSEIAVGCADSTITFYDRRKMDTPLNRIRCQTTKNMPRRITSLQYDMSGSMVLANILCEKIQLLNLHVKEQLDEGNAKKLEDPKELFPAEPLPIKRLRLRGDWSDTGPNSRPGQRPAEATTGTSRFMVEISDLMTTWMRNQMAAPPPPAAQAVAGPSAPPRRPLVAATDRSGGGGRNDSGIEDLLSSAAQRSKKVPDDLVILKPILEYSGHRSSRTMIKEAAFWDDSFVISGSDCGRVFVWNRHTGKLVNVMEGDKHVVNCIRPHPTEFALATSGIDHDVKIWRPTKDEAAFDSEEAQSIMETNNQMLEETRDTVTVPAVCVVKILRAMAQRSQQGDRERQERQGANNAAVNEPGDQNARDSGSEEE